jgi:hypothetical protein
MDCDGEIKAGGLQRQFGSVALNESNAILQSHPARHRARRFTKLFRDVDARDVAIELRSDRARRTAKAASDVEDRCSGRMFRRCASSNVAARPLIWNSSIDSISRGVNT